MATRTPTQIRAQIDTIRQEQINGANTRARVSDTLEDMFDSGQITAHLPDGTTQAVSGVASALAVVRDGVVDVSGYTRGELLRDVRAACGAKIIDGWMGEDLSDLSLTVETWPSQFASGTALSPAGSGSHFGLVRDRLGRKAAACSTYADRALVKAGGTTKAVVVVFASDRAVNGGSSYGVLCATDNSHFALMTDAGKSEFNDTNGVNGSPIVYRDGVLGSAYTMDPQVYYSEITSSSATGLLVGGLTGFAYSCPGRIYAVLQLSATLTAGELAAMTAAYRTYYGIRQARNVYIDGNSIMAGYSGIDYWTPLELRHCTKNQISTSGHQWTDVISGLSAGIASVDRRGFRDEVVVVYEDFNSLNPSGGNATAAQVIQWGWDYAAAVRAAGAKVILTTCIPSTYLTGGAETNRLAVNAARRSGWADHADALLDLAALAPFVAGSYLADGTHLTSMGYGYWGDQIKAAVDALP